MGVHPIKSKSLPSGRTFSVVIYDLLFENTDCIVNPANGGLSHGGGVAAAISKSAGPALDDECDKIINEHGRIAVGEAVVTTAGNLPFKGVIHAVGPRLGIGDEKAKIIQALHSAFLRASEKGWTSLSFPAVSSGIFAVPSDICAAAYVQSVDEFFEKYPESSLKTIRLCLYKGNLVDAVLKEMNRSEFPLIDSKEEPENEDVTVYEIDDEDF
jgi:O-acetyl-ADP-ribose deacetylase